MIDAHNIRGLGRQLMHVTRLLRKHFDRRATRFELTRSQWRALKVISHQEGLSQTELAELLELEPIPVGRVIDRLQQAGFVERRPDPGDRRRWCLHLSDKARGVVEDMEKIADGLRQEAVEGVSKSDYETFERVLTHIKHNLVALDQAEMKQDSRS
ncbi:MAG: MarR family transcriptional regulator [Rhodanobacteraceae bacterium]